MEPWFEAELKQPVTIPPLHLLRRCHPRGDHGTRKRLSDYRMGGAQHAGINFHLRGRPRLKPPDSERFAADDPRPQRCGQRAYKFFILAERHAVGELIQVRRVDRNFGRIARGDYVCGRLPLIRLLAWVPSRREQAAKSIAANRQTLDRLSVTRIMENQDCPAPCMHILCIQHRRDHRLFKIFTRHHQPHINALFAHDGRNDRIQPRG